MRYATTVHSVTWFKDHYQTGTLEIRPAFQRKPVWGLQQKNSLIETVLLGLPIPEIFIQQITTPDGDVRYAIVDGQQRVRTVLQFIGVEKDLSEGKYVSFPLTQLKDASPWKNLTFEDLTPDERISFYQYNFGIRELYTADDKEIRQMFARLNINLTALSNQEVRNALFSGPFIDLATGLADDSYW